jgi:hypothetical protein
LRLREPIITGVAGVLVSNRRFVARFRGRRSITIANTTGTHQSLMLCPRKGFRVSENCIRRESAPKGYLVMVASLAWSERIS